MWRVLVLLILTAAPAAAQDIIACPGPNCAAGGSLCGGTCTGGGLPDGNTTDLVCSGLNNGQTQVMDTGLLEWCDGNAQRRSSAPLVFSALDYGAIGDGATDDTAAIQRAIDAACALEIPTSTPVTVDLSNGTFLVNTVGTSYPGVGGNPWILAIPCSNLTLQGNGLLRTTVAGARMLRVTGACALDGVGACSHYATQRIVDGTSNPTIYTLTGSYAQGVQSITLATAGDAANFTAGDYVLIRTGATLSQSDTEPDSEYNQIATADAGTGVLTLVWPTVKPYGQEKYCVTADCGGGDNLCACCVGAGGAGCGSDAHGFTCFSGCSGSNAPYGVQKATDRVLRNVTIKDLQFESTAEHTAGILSTDQVLGMEVSGVRMTTAGGCHGGGGYRFMDWHDTVCHHTGSTAGAAETSCFQAAWGTADFSYHDNLCISDAIATNIHAHEGSANGLIANNTIWMPDNAGGVAEPISIRSRSYNMRVVGNQIFGWNSNSGIHVDQWCRMVPPVTAGGECGGGSIVGNTITVNSTASGALNVRSGTWTGAGTNTFLGSGSAGQFGLNTNVSNSATCGLSNVGDMCLDSTSGQIQYRDGASGGTNRVVDPSENACLQITDFTTITDKIWRKTNRALTIIGVNCIVDDGTVVLTPKECNANAASCGNITAAITCGTTNTGATVTDASTAALAWWRIAVGATTGSPTQAVLCISYTVAAT